MFDRNADQLVKETRDASRHAVSHRQYQVGCAILAFNETTDECQIFTGVNIKPFEGETPKFCAVQGALSSAFSKGFKTIVAVATAGPAESDDATGKEAETVQLCCVCRWLFYHLEQNLETIIITTLNGEGPTIQTTLHEVIVQYGTAIPAKDYMQITMSSREQS
jgi:cytidine deaminase